MQRGSGTSCDGRALARILEEPTSYNLAQGETQTNPCFPSFPKTVVENRLKPRHPMGPNLFRTQKVGTPAIPPPYWASLKTLLVELFIVGLAFLWARVASKKSKIPPLTSGKTSTAKKRSLIFYFFLGGFSSEFPFKATAKKVRPTKRHGQIVLWGCEIGRI